MGNETVVNSPNIAKKLAVHFGFACLFVFIMLSINQLFLIRSFLAEKQFTLSQCGALFLYSLPGILAMGLPFAVCIGFIRKSGLIPQRTFGPRSAPAVISQSIRIGGLNQTV